MVLPNNFYITITITRIVQKNIIISNCYIIFPNGVNLDSFFFFVYQL